MFTGIVSHRGTVASLGPNVLRVEAEGLNLEPGGSIAVNGCCLTAREADRSSFTADVVPETLRRTNLGSLRVGDTVNLERPLTLATPLDGHLVQGHVDSTATVLVVEPADTGQEVEISLPQELSRFVTEKGSIAVDGTSLTVAKVASDRFRVAFIPHTLAVTRAGSYIPGSVVNLEVDLLARYLERLLDRGIK